MKTCPVCGAKSFDDMQVCFGCMHVFDKEDLVHHPSHYESGGIECIDAIRAQLGPEGFQAYCHGNVAKYLWRWKQKGGVQDLDKAQVYLGWMIDSVKTKIGPWSNGSDTLLQRVVLNDKDEEVETALVSVKEAEKELRKAIADGSAPLYGSQGQVTGYTDGVDCVEFWDCEEEKYSECSEVK